MNRSIKIEKVPAGLGKCVRMGCGRESAVRVTIPLPMVESISGMLGKLLGGLDRRNFLTYRGVRRFYLCLMDDDLFESNPYFRRLIKLEHL